MTKQALGELSIHAVGVRLTAAIATANVAIPNDASANVAKYVRVKSLGTCYVRPGASGVVATNADIYLTADESIILNVKGCTHIAALREGGADTAIVISPIEAG
jgi:hypothetical protein